MTVVTLVKDLIESGREKVFLQCLESVASQDYPNIEHLIMDGASLDGTLHLLEAAKQYGDIRIVSSRDKGIWDAAGKATLESKGSIINFLNSDDYFCRSDAVSSAVRKLRDSDAEWHFSRAWIIRPDGTRWLFPSAAIGTFACMGIVHQTVFISKEVLLAANPFSTAWRTKENFLFLLLLRNNVPYSFDKDPMVCYREGGFSSDHYGGDNFYKTQDDFGEYMFQIHGQALGLSINQCRFLFGNAVLTSKFGKIKHLFLPIFLPKHPLVTILGLPSLLVNFLYLGQQVSQILRRVIAKVKNLLALGPNHRRTSANSCFKNLD